MKRRVLMTGATGYIGRHLLPLVQAHHDVVVVGRKSPGQNIDFIACDLLQDDLGKVCQQAQAESLIHLAWNVQGNYWHASDHQLWKNKTLELVRSFAASGGSRVMVTGTCAEYEWQGEGLCDESQTALASETAYAKAKNETHQHLRAFCRQKEMILIWPRVFYSFGPGEPSQKLIPSLIQKFVEQQIGVCKQGNQWLDYLYIKDLASALNLTFLHSLGGAVNMSSGEGLYLPNLLEKLAIQCDALPFLSVDLKNPVFPRKVVGLNAQLLEFGWRPGYTLEQALNETIAEWKQRHEIDY